MPWIRTAAARLLLAATTFAATTARAAPLTADEMQRQLAGLVAGAYPASSCRPTEDDGVIDGDAGFLTIAPDGHVTGPSIDLGMFAPGATFNLDRAIDGKPRALGSSVEAYANGRSFRIERRASSDSPGSLVAGSGRPYERVTHGTRCAALDFSSAKLAAPAFDFAADLASLFATTAPARGRCHGRQDGKTTARDVEFTLDTHGVTVDGVTLPFDAPSRPLERTSVGTNGDGTLNVYFLWADRSDFATGRVIGRDGFAAFGFSIAGKPDAQAMTCEFAKP